MNRLLFLLRMMLPFLAIVPAQVIKVDDIQLYDGEWSDVISTYWATWFLDYEPQEEDTRASCSTNVVGDGEFDLEFFVDDRFFDFINDYARSTAAVFEMEVVLIAGSSKLTIDITGIDMWDDYFGFRDPMQVMVKCTLLEPAPAPTASPTVGWLDLPSGVQSEILSLNTDEEQYYVHPLEFPDTIGTVTCTATGKDGNADLMVKWDEFPVPGGDSDCVSESSKSKEECTVAVIPGAFTRLYVLVYASETFTDLTVTCTSDSKCDPSFFRMCILDEDCCTGQCGPGGRCIGQFRDMYGLVYKYNIVAQSRQARQRETIY